MKDLQGLSKQIVELVQLLSEAGELEIKAEVSFDEGPSGFNDPRVLVHLTGRDTAMLTADNGQVLEAIESLSLDMLGLPDTEREHIHFDAGNFLAAQRIRLRKLAERAVREVGFSGTPHVFPAMSARDRKLLEEALLASGQSFETLGQQPTQWVILLPKEQPAPLEGTPEQHSSHN